MHKNMGPTDRKLRIFAVVLATSAASRCPIYLPFGLSTCAVPTATATGTPFAR